MTTRYITLSVGTSNIMTTSVTTMQTFMEINKTLKAIKGVFKSSYAKGYSRKKDLGGEDGRRYIFLWVVGA